MFGSETQVPRFLFDRHRLNALQAELDALRDECHRLRSLGHRVLVAPERVGCNRLAFRLQLFPQLRGRVSVGRSVMVD